MGEDEAEGSSGSKSSKLSADMCLRLDGATMYAALTVISELGGTPDYELGIVLDGAWCAEQARSALHEVKKRRTETENG